MGQPFAGPRVDPRRADEIRYFKRADRNDDRDRFTLLIVDGVPRRDLQTRYQLGFGAPPADFKTEPEQRRTREPPPAAAGVEVGRPTVTFVFGVRDVNRVVRLEDKDGKEGARSGYPQIAPMRALGLRLEPTRAQLVDITRPSYTEGRPWDGAGLTMKPLGERALSRSAAGATVDVNVRVEGNKLKVSVAGETFELPIDRPESGFYGFLIEQPGYVALRQLDCGGLRP